jgi:hypothetical protein
MFVVEKKLLYMKLKSTDTIFQLLNIEYEPCYFIFIKYNSSKPTNA